LSNEIEDIVNDNIEYLGYTSDNKYLEVTKLHIAGSTFPFMRKIPTRTSLS